MTSHADEAADLMAALGGAVDRARERRQTTARESRGVQVEALRVEPTRPLTKEQRTALALLQDMRRRYPEETWDGITCSGYTWPQLGTTWPAYINWRTARSLQRLGLVTTEYVGPDEGSTITLTAVGVEA